MSREGSLLEAYADSAMLSLRRYLMQPGLRRKNELSLKKTPSYTPTTKTPPDNASVKRRHYPLFFGIDKMPGFKLAVLFAHDFMALFPHLLAKIDPDRKPERDKQAPHVKTPTLFSLLAHNTAAIALPIERGAFRQPVFSDTVILAVTFHMHGRIAPAH